MTVPARRPDPPYRRIVAEISARITSGELRPGDRVPSVRQIARRWNVALATATKVMAVLRDEGLVETRVGSGTVVSARAARSAGSGAPRGGAGGTRAGLGREQILSTAVAIADAEGLEALSMRRLAAELGVGAMSLYRHVSGKSDLVTQMADLVIGEEKLPDPGPPDWRAKLELVARLQWRLYRRHLWLPRVISFTRPLLAPNLMACTEWTLRALDGLGLPMTVRVRETITLASLVVTVAQSLAEEVEAGQESGVTTERWWSSQEERIGEIFAGGRFPLLAAAPEEAVTDLDALFEYALTCHLDGFAALVERYARAAT